MSNLPTIARFSYFKGKTISEELYSINYKQKEMDDLGINDLKAIHKGLSEFLELVANKE